MIFKPLSKRTLNQKLFLFLAHHYLVENIPVGKKNPVKNTWVPGSLAIRREELSPSVGLIASRHTEPAVAGSTTSWKTVRPVFSMVLVPIYTRRRIRIEVSTIHIRRRPLKYNISIVAHGYPGEACGPFGSVQADSEWRTTAAVGKLLVYLSGRC